MRGSRSNAINVFVAHLSYQINASTNSTSSQEEREAKELAEIERDYEKRLAAHQKYVKVDLEKLQRQQAAATVTLTKIVKQRNAKELKSFRNAQADELKTLHAQVGAMPKVCDRSFFSL